MKKNPKIGIIGVGMVGGALKKYFEKKGITPLAYDKGKKIGSVKNVNKADIIFVCVPTPYTKERGFDLSYVEDACNKTKGEKIIVIKSTVIPGTTKKLQKIYPSHRFLFNPEFLVEKRAEEDMQNPNRQIVGYTSESKTIAKNILNILPKAPFEKVIPSTEAEIAKYFGNTFLATKVIFANQIYDLCQKIGANYKTVKRCASADKRVGVSHLDVEHEGYRGYGGNCFTKDIRALIQFAEQKGVNLELHKTVEKINKKLKNPQS